MSIKLTNRPRETIVAFAKSQIGVRETSRNRGPELAKFWDATDYPDGDENREPWCAAFVAWCVQQAGAFDDRLVVAKRPRSAAVRNWVPAALKLGWKVFGPRDGFYFPSPGDIFTLAKVSHIGIVEDFDGTFVTTIEGNTNDEGSREGYEVARRKRDLRECKSFIRVPAREN